MALTLKAIIVSAALFVGALFFADAARADHNVYLPLVPNTPLMQQIIKTQEYTWCVDSRASSYPNFVSQLKDVTDQYTKLTGIRSRQVAFSDSSCQVRHTMPDSFSCGSGAAACIYYGNWPVTVEYKFSLGYFDWRSAQGHELGHGVLGLHEQYKDSGGGIGCDASYQAMINRLGFPTVMSCGTGVQYPQPTDITRGCAVLKTVWCGTDGTSTRVYFPDGWSYDTATGIWWNPQNQPEWSPCNADSLRWNFVIQAWLPPGSAFYLPTRGYWSLAGAC